uniref:Uncharacterized protein n=1 Tax=Brassica campestris TaxID=3711 RepID=A0A3P6CNZ4_BRACM|nr:unnamed protein product [Brassica rapa]
MTRLQQIPMVSFLLSSSAPTTQTAQLNHGAHLSLKNPSVARGNSLGLMSPDPPNHQIRRIWDLSWLQWGWT